MRSNQRPRPIAKDPSTVTAIAKMTEYWLEGREAAPVMLDVVVTAPEFVGAGLVLGFVRDLLRVGACFLRFERIGGSKGRERE